MNKQTYFRLPSIVFLSFMMTLGACTTQTIVKSERTSPTTWDCSTISFSGLQGGGVKEGSPDRCIVYRIDYSSLYDSDETSWNKFFKQNCGVYPHELTWEVSGATLFNNQIKVCGSGTKNVHMRSNYNDVMTSPSPVKDAVDQQDQIEYDSQRGAVNLWDKIKLFFLRLFTGQW